MSERYLIAIMGVLAAVIAVVPMASVSVARQAQTAAQRATWTAPAGGVPRFQVDPTWPKLPNNWVMGQVSSVAVDQRDHVWLLHRPRTVAEDRKDQAAPPVLEFEATGKFVQGWGGLSDAYEWPDTERSIFVDYKDNVWIDGSNPNASVRPSSRSDNMLLKFTNKGKFVLQIGRRDQSGGNKDTKNLRQPAGLFVYRKTNELFVADGYGNRRVIVLDADTGTFKRMWGAFGNTPLDRPTAPGRPTSPAGGTAATAAATLRQQPVLDEEGPGPQQFEMVLGVTVSDDGLVYVADANNRRIQVFTIAGKYVTQVFINRKGPATLSVVGTAFSPDPQQQFMYVADYGGSHIVVVDRKPLKVLDSFGSTSSNPGDFQNLHQIAVDSKGNLYTAESGQGRRAQKFVFKGMSFATTR